MKHGLEGHATSLAAGVFCDFVDFSTNELPARASQYAEDVF